MTGVAEDPAAQLIASLWADPALGGLALTGANRPTPARSNLLYLGLGGLTDGALATTGVCCSVPIYVVPGDVITTVNIPLGATAASTPTHYFAALYSGVATTPARLAQSADGTTTAIAASAVLAQALTAPVTITQAMAPTGFIYATIAITASTIPTAAAASTPTAVHYQWFTSMPLGVALTHGSAVGATAPTTIASSSPKAVAPIIILT